MNAGILILFIFSHFPASHNFSRQFSGLLAMDLDQTVPTGSSLISVHSVCFHNKI